MSFFAFVLGKIQQKYAQDTGKGVYTAQFF